MLASASPRRRELLQQIGVAVEVVVPDVEEAPRPGEDAADYVCRLAREKAHRVLRRHPQRTVLAADTAVVLDGELLGKPEDATGAQQMLRRLSDHEHRVLTAVHLCHGGFDAGALSDTRVRFRELSADEIRAYVNSGEPLDKAGAYGIQGRGAVFVSHIAGSYSGVVGLPLFETARLFRQAGLKDL